VKELEAFKKKQKRDATVTNGVLDSPIRPPSTPPSPSKQDNATREELKGLKYVLTIITNMLDNSLSYRVIVQNLQKDNHTATQQIKTLEAENKLLLSETEQLRVVCIILRFCYYLFHSKFMSQELKALEESFDQAIMREETALAAEEATPISEGSADALQKALKETKSKFEVRPLRPDYSM
jgi:CAP-Gly domain-containing linker protein 1